MPTRSSRHRHLYAGTAALLLITAAPPAWAQETAQTAAGTTAATQVADGQDTTALKPIVLRDGTSVGKSDSPLTETTDRQVIQDRMVTDFKDFSRRVDAGVTFNRQSQSINIRGLQNERVLTTIDGIRQPWLTDPRDSARGGNNAFDFDTLSTIDITKGADSSRVGSGALGGAVQLYTINPEDLIEDGRNFGALTKSTYDSADRSLGNNAAIAARHNDSWFMLQGGYKRGNETDNEGDIGGYGTTRTEANPGDYWQRNLLAKFHQYIEGGHRFGLTGELFNKEIDSDNMRGTTTSYQQGTLKSGEEVDRKRLSASYDFISPSGGDIVDQASIIAYWQKQRLNNTTDGFRLTDPRGSIISGDPFFYGSPSGIYSRDNQLTQDSYGISGSASKELTIGGVSHEFRFGGELSWQKTYQYSSGVDNCPDVDWTTIPQPFGPQSCRMLHSNSSDMPDVDGMIFGMYAEDDIKFFEDRLTVTPGVRFDWYDYDPKSTASFEDSPNYDPAYLESNNDFGISPKLRFGWKATQELELFAQYARGFRAPTATELYQNYGAPGSYARIGNPDLETETSNGFEIGAKYDAADYSFKATAFNNYYKNFIDTVTIAPPGGEYPVGGITGYENLNHVRIYGIELGGEWRFDPRWRTWGSFAYSHGKDTDTGDYLNSVAPLRAIIGLGYSSETWGSDVSLTLASSRNKVSGTGFEAPGYGLVDTTVWWAPEKVGTVDLSGLKVQAGVFNVFDKKYFDAVSVPDGVSASAQDFYSEPGRSFKLSVTKKF
ncbi:TonB-dependent hemoglobin/transferrin/lactoferrin family receptor [Rhizobium sp. CFBP 8752]|uniref:TonB-dependent hemoglobin/transferrin/lactoferrin family receptor n=1 Tax=Rhizobium sp. CFBP 8752 TaxID=2775301 RepID=UPI00177E5169|nr:TonB-dependent hemoglobin/transferrin/lactoferrin family receptor [Rhizobium sp. CFBP 8752]MBD8662582.1 TonB-dependent hemoglobin/transferrin/lactoferrin family receptor [Rhizobium sp. CFBP 8752]